jgi:hypothetical protein
MIVFEGNYACSRCREILTRQKDVGCYTYDKECADAIRKIAGEEGLLKALSWTIKDTKFRSSYLKL